MSNFRLVHGVSVPLFLYGTAWKEQRTHELTAKALAAGFRGIDTANQRKHYFEAAVGSGLAETQTPRDEVFLQTKFTYQRGQDHRLPYDPNACLTDQVAQSFASSLEHLQTDFVDSYVLHGPSSGRGIQDADREVWRAMEALQQRGAARLIGVSNISLPQLEILYAGAEVKPAMVQNRCFARTQWDSDVRSFCRANDLTYQGFSLLTANRAELQRPAIHTIADRHGCTVPQLVFAFARQVGMICLTGTSDDAHMAQDLDSVRIELSEDELRVVERIGV